MSVDVGIASIAIDLIEMERVDEARALLDAELPNRLAEPCAACGAPAKFACSERALRPCNVCDEKGEQLAANLETGERKMVPCWGCGGRLEREVNVDLVVPHESRLLGIRRRW